MMKTGDTIEAKAEGLGLRAACCRFPIVQPAAHPTATKSPNSSGRFGPRVSVLIIALILCATVTLPAQSPAVKETPSPNTPVPAATVSVPVELQGLSVRADGVSQTNVDDVKAVLEEQLGLAGDTSMSDPLADDMAFFLRQRLLDLGYPEATVAWTVEGGTAVLKVEEGPRYLVGTITFEGNTSQKEDDLRAYLLRPTHEKLGRNDANPPLVENDIQKGAEMVQRYFQAQGYLNAVVAEPQITMRSETKTQDILVKITEGPRYDIGHVSVTGDWESQRKEVMAAIEGMTGQPFSEVKIEEVRKQLVGLYQQRGYFAAEVISSADLSRVRGGPVPVVYQVIPGNLFRIVGISVAPGFSKGADRIVRASFKRSVNHVYSPADLEVMHKQALKSDVFSRLDVTPKKMTDDTITLELTGEEGPTRTRAAYVGYETFKGPIVGGELRKVNIFNSGNAGQLKAEWSGVGITGVARLTDPAVFNTSHTLDMSLYADGQDIFDYKRQSYGGKVVLSRQWTKEFSTNIFGDYSMNTSESDVLTPEELGPDDYNLGIVGFSTIIDFRDSPVLPSKGFVFNGSISGTLGGDISYTRADFSFAYFVRFTKKMRAALLARTSAIRPERSLDEVPIDLRLFNGGANSVRSFAEREMGLKSINGDTPVGGTLSQTFSVEFSYEVAKNLELAVFTDMGTLTREEDTVFSRPEDVRYAVGLGIRYKLPVGPLRIDYGYNLNREEGEDMGALHITFGYAF
ncbi:Beta-barrel assembly machine subunit BamA [Roseimicrobium gellanilyticum]|uniref:Beta-barrel assembly machine subunit BamA n=1 Tax=Roseimicrobium gellanilyticum TaxID=748857 RepID=A0A366H8K1_9BACT|nr:BamA/TamA family outer membrane protein [Roseimicrobium gellanilyticum]RBP38559.1 Beta-barrel assembly machine subunit BamA [Roseimicrobium gellanilyticum]